MEAYRSAGYKPPLIKSIFLLVSVLFLVAVNFFLFSFSFVWFLIFLIFGLLWRGMMRVLTRMYYGFDENGIEINLPNKKSLRLEKTDIVEVIGYSGTLPKWRGIGVFSQGSITFCISSFEQLLEVKTKDGKSYVLSPRRIEDRIYSYYVA